MIVSRNWLTDYVELSMSDDELVDRLTMSGLNHEGTEVVGGDQAIDLEVTSNRPDCLGHIGVAREIAVLFDQALRIPEPQIETIAESIDDCFQVEIQAPELCYRFTARLIRGVKVGPSPQWLVDRLETAGLATVNNIVDVSNYVMLECGQPLHAFDYAKLQDRKIIVREPLPDETLQAINHHTYSLEPGMCVIADGKRAVGLGGVMGGADTEVSESTVDVLIEAAHFNPLAIRHTARKLNLFSPASYRFERPIDSQRIGWASQRCCELILQTAGGQLLEGMIDIGNGPAPREPVRLRFAQIDRLLGIPVPREVVRPILSGLGCDIQETADDSLSLIPPSWRADITREVDLVEEVGRVYGYDRVPDDGVVPMAATIKTPLDRVTERIRRAMSACGFDECITCSVVPEPWSESFSPWTDRPPLASHQPMLGVLEKSSQNIGQVNLLRRSVVPSLLEVFRINDFKGNSEIHLYEMAKVYLPKGDLLPHEPLMLAMASESGYTELKGAVEAVLEYLNPSVRMEIEGIDLPLLDINRSARVSLDGHLLGFIGEVSQRGKEDFSIRQDVAIAELDVHTLLDITDLVPIHQEISPFPPITRDFNFIVDESVRWSELENAVHSGGGEILESVEYRETFRNPDKDGANKKRILVTVVLRSIKQTLTGEQADAVSDNIIRKCQEQLDAQLLG